MRAAPEEIKEMDDWSKANLIGRFATYRNNVIGLLLILSVTWNEETCMWDFVTYRLTVGRGEIWTFNRDLGLMWDLRRGRHDVVGLRILGITENNS